MRLPALAIEKSAVVWFAVLLLVIGGFAAFKSLGQLEDPEFTIKTVVVTTAYPGASPEEVEQEVTERIELKLQELQEIDYIESFSRAGLSTVKVQIQPSYTSEQMPQIQDKLRRKVHDVETALPPGAERPVVNDDFGDVFGLLLAVTADGYSLAELKAYVDGLKRELALVEGVAKVDLWGAQQRAIYLEVRQSRLAQLGLSEDSIEQTLQSQNLVVDAGAVDIADNRLRIAPTGAFLTTQDIAELVVRPSALDVAQAALGPRGVTRATEASPDALLRIGDIGEVREGYRDPPTTLLRYDGLPAIALAISSQPGVNVVDVGRVVDRRLHDLVAELPVGVEVHRVHWQSDAIQEAVDGFFMSLLQAIVIVLAVLALAMGVRMGVIIGSGLLLTILATFIVMALFGIDLQRMSLGALVIALGMMVDHSIVVADGAAARLAQGADPREAAIEAASRPAWPLLGATFIAVLAFYPIYASNEGAGEYCAPLFSVVAISLLASWVLSVTVTPLQCLRTLRPPKMTGAPAREGRMLRLYLGFLRSCIRFRYVTIGVAVAALVVSAASFGLVTKLFFPDSSMPKLMIDYTAPEGTRIEQVDREVRRLETHLADDPRVAAVASFIGAGPPRFYLPVDPEPRLPRDQCPGCGPRAMGRGEPSRSPRADPAVRCRACRDLEVRGAADRACQCRSQRVAPHRRSRCRDPGPPSLDTRGPDRLARADTQGGARV
jgi:multidrug efflux pump subunit AcrB